jgi:hypothetical protein
MIGHAVNIAANEYVLFLVAAEWQVRRVWYRIQNHHFAANAARQLAVRLHCSSLLYAAFVRFQQQSASYFSEKYFVPARILKY